MRADARSDSAPRPDPDPDRDRVSGAAPSSTSGSTSPPSASPASGPRIRRFQATMRRDLGARSPNPRLTIVAGFTGDDWIVHILVPVVAVRARAVTIFEASGADAPPTARDAEGMVRNGWTLLERRVEHEFLVFDHHDNAIRPLDEYRRLRGATVARVVPCDWHPREDHIRLAPTIAEVRREATHHFDAVARAMFEPMQL